MATRNHNYTIDLDKPLTRQNMGLLLATGDSNGDVFNFDLTRSGTAETLGGAVTVAGYFVRNDAATIAMYGSYSGNRASVTLPASCYVEDGYFTLAVRVTAGGAKTTIAVIDGYIRTTTTDTLIDPGTVVPTLDDVLNAIAEMEAVTAEGEATIATIKADTAAAIKTTNEATAAANTATVELAKTAAPAITPTVSGSIVTITDGADRPAVQFVTHIEPVQAGSGDPSPDNVRPISGWNSATACGTGKNLLKTFGHNSGAIVSNGIVEFKSAIDSYFFISPVNIPDGVELTVSFDANSFTGTLELSVYNRQDYSIFLIPGRRNAITFVYKKALNEGDILIDDKTRTSMDAVLSNFQLELGTTATAYEPYSGQTLTASLPETVYGGTLDWGTGVLMRSPSETGETLTTTQHQDGFDSDDTAVFSFTLQPCKHSERLNLVCSHFPVTDNPQYNAANECCGFNNIEQYNAYFYIRIKKNRLSSVSIDGMDAWLRSQQDFRMVYVSEQPEIIQLTPQQLNTLKGTNNVWSDTGDTDLTYIADTQRYIDQKFSALEAGLLSTGANV